MSESIESVIVELQTELDEREAKVVETKRLINHLCSRAGREPLFPDEELEGSQRVAAFLPDEFYGQPLTKAMRRILEYRKATRRGPATPREIYEALVAGGFEFATKNEQNRLTGLRISLRKSSSIFHRLPDGKRYGLLEWYPAAKRKRRKEDASPDDDSLPDEDDVDELDDAPDDSGEEDMDE